MRKRLLLTIPLALLGSVLLYTLAAWGLREWALRPLSGRLAITNPQLNSGRHTYTTGSFIITLSAIGQEAAGGYGGPRLTIAHSAEPGRWLLHTLRGEAFVGAAQGIETVQEARGSYFFSDRLEQTCADQVIDRIDELPSGVRITGSLSCSSGKMVGYTLIFSAPTEDQLAFSLSFNNPELNRSYLSYASDSDEHFFGFGEQFSRFDQKGHRVPIWVSEQGIGRGAQPVTALVNLAARAGGSDTTTYAAAPHYITSRLRSLFLENGEYSVFDLRAAERVQVSTFSGQMQGRILYGADPEALIASYTSWAGRMRPLPDWILEGAVVGMQGGEARVRDVYAQLKARGTPLSAFWLQDWVGQRTTSFGKQLWWNWELDRDRYPGWDALRADLAADNVRMMVYVSPFIADVAALKPNLRRNLFQEATQAGYLVKNKDGSPYLIQNTDFSAGLLDLTNPDAVDWYKSVLADEVVAAGVSGWMADFGEALPYDAQLSSGESAAAFHNRYPEAWARLNRQFVDGLTDGDQMVFFTRAAFQQSPAYTSLMWEGDQLTTWDADDGLRSAVTGLLSGGMSGFSLNHSDIGGYTGINNPLLKISRGKELLMRWMELSAFTTIYRTHEGNTPDQNAQFYSDDETLAHFDRFARVYRAWAPMRKRLVQQAAATGVPVARPLFINYPDDPISYRDQQDEFLLGPDVLVAPVLDPGQTTRRLYLPAGNWVHLWSGRPYRSPFDGQWVTVDAPLGQPPVFYKEGTDDGEDLVEALKVEGMLVLPTHPPPGSRISSGRCRN